MTTIMKKPGHLERFPCMSPWMTNSYEDNRHKRLLVIGESHYMPECSDIHLDPECWYQSNQDHLDEGERGWVDTRGVIKGFFEHPRRGHRIFRNIETQITKILEKGGLTVVPGERALQHIAFYNYSLRPAPKTGDSMKGYDTPQDHKISEEVLRWFIREHQPELVIFVSRFAGGYGESIVREHGIPCISTPHPGCSWWNRYNNKYGRNPIYEGAPGSRRGRDLFYDFLTKHHWIT